MVLSTLQSELFMIQNTSDACSYVCCCRCCLLSHHVRCIGISLKESIFGRTSPWILDMVHVVSRHLMVFILFVLNYACSCQFCAMKDWWSVLLKTVQLVIMRTSGKLAVFLQMLLYPHYADTWFKTECPFYLSIQLLLFIILPQELGISATAELEQSTF